MGVDHLHDQRLRDTHSNADPDWNSDTDYNPHSNAAATNRYAASAYPNSFNANPNSANAIANFDSDPDTPGYAYAASPTGGTAQQPLDSDASSDR
jgi:hypothetical protein